MLLAHSTWTSSPWANVAKQYGPHWTRYCHIRGRTLVHLFWCRYLKLRRHGRIQSSA